MKIVRYCIVGLLLLLSLRVWATHIVGGEIELIHRKDSLYELRMILYFDEVNGNPAAEDQQANLYIFSKSGGQLMDIFNLPKTSRVDVQYTVPECAIAALETDRIEYVQTVVLEGDRYNDPAGYEAVWERCCRNETITNVESTGFNVGQTFILDFPAVVDENGDPFINSSPNLFPPLRDFACVGQFYFADFSGFDRDGDSIVYSLEDPLNSSSPNALPTPNPAPHIPIDWLEGFSVDNMVPGKPALKISDNGLLTVTPTMAGLFLFAIKAEEFRDGIKIGEVRRDFQMLVIDCPDPGVAPVVQAELPESGIFLSDFDTLSFGPDDNNCFNFYVTDQDGGENIILRALPVNFTGTIDSIFQVRSGLIGDPSDTLEVEVCIPLCPFIPGELAVIDLVAWDGTCPLPLQDTLTLVLDIAEPPNNPPVISSTLTTDRVELFIGDTVEFQVFGTDLDLDNLVVTGIPQGFTFDSLGIFFDGSDGFGVTTAEFVWIPSCEGLLLEQPTEFKILFVTEDKDQCGRINADSLEVTLVLIPTPNTPPQFLVGSPTSLELTVGDLLDFDLIGIDDEDDSLLVSLVESNLSSLDFVFEENSGIGPVATNLSWQTRCVHLSENFGSNSFEFKFLVQEKGGCFPKADTLVLNVKLMDIENPGELAVPPNVFTPNGDGINETFSIPNLPKDNCSTQFESFTVFNRWGKLVFEGRNRDFAWDGGSNPSGVYYYYLEYNNFSYNGIVSIVR